MAPTSTLALAAVPPQQNSAASAPAGVEDVETAVWSWQAPAPAVGAMPALTAGDVPQQAADPLPATTKRPSAVFAAAALLGGLVVVLVVSLTLVQVLGSGHRQAAPSATLAGGAGQHESGLEEGDNATLVPAAVSTTLTTVTTAATIEEVTTSSVESTTTSLMSSVESPTTSTSLTPAAASAGVSTTSLRGSVRCYNLYSQLNVNALQKHPDNPDSEAFGFATCTLCTNGTAVCTSLLHSGKSQLIASHIHLAEGADADGSTGEGPPVINFCGSNAQGLIADGADYSGPCEQWKDGAAHNVDVAGILVPNFNRGITAAQRVEDIVKRPNMYFLNFHSLASWNHWYPHPRGMARGVMVLQGLAK